MARSSAVPGDAMNQVAVSFIEAGLKQHKTVKELLEAMRREPAFAGVGRARLIRHWSEVWRPMVAEGGRVPLPRRGGDRRASSAARIPRQSKAVPSMPARPVTDRAALEEMLDLVSAMLAEAPDSPARDTALRAFPGFVRSVREVVKHM